MYERFLRALLEPLGVYDLGNGSLNAAELSALGAGMDAVSIRMETAEREAVTATAEGEGLLRRESLFSGRNAAITPEERRAAIAALLQIAGDSLTPSAINRTLRGCGIKAWAQELGGGKLRILFPEVAGIPADFERIEQIVQEILPCHLEAEFYFRYLTWEECHRAGYVWADLDAAQHTWESFQVAVSPMAEAMLI